MVPKFWVEGPKSGMATKGMATKGMVTKGMVPKSWVEGPKSGMYLEAKPTVRSAILKRNLPSHITSTI